MLILLFSLQFFGVCRLDGSRRVYRVYVFFLRMVDKIERRVRQRETGMQQKKRQESMRQRRKKI